MKVSQKSSKSKIVKLQYPKWPDDGVAMAEITEWENGEGFDIKLDGTKIELTMYELMAISTLYQLFSINEFINS